MLPVEQTDPAEYANFEKEFLDYTPDCDDNRDSIKEYALNGTVLYVRSLNNRDLFIHCLNLENGDCYPLCSKPECFHDSSACNAFAGSSHYLTMDLKLEYPGVSWLSLYEGRLIAYDTQNIFYRRLDGTGGEDIGSLQHNFNGSSNYGFSARAILTHRGYVYTGQKYFTENGFVLSFVRIPISGGEKEILWERAIPKEAQEQYNQTEFNYYYGIGNKIYFFVDDQIQANGKKSTKLYCYNTEKDEVSLYREFIGISDYYYPANGKWYYAIQGVLYSWDPKTDEEHSIYTYEGNSFQDKSGTTYYNGGFCLWEKTKEEKADPTQWNPDNVSEVVFYDWDGNFITKVKPPLFPKPMIYYTKGFFENYLVYVMQGMEFEEDKSHYKYYTAVLDTSRLTDPSLEWMIFEFAD